MGMFFSTELNTLDDLLLLEINDLYDAEKRLVEALPEMAEAATAHRFEAGFPATFPRRHSDKSPG